MKFYINNNELSEKSILENTRFVSKSNTKSTYLGWNESEDCQLFMLDWNSVMLLKVNMTDEIVNQVIYYFSLFICRINTKLTELIHLVYFLI